MDKRRLIILAGSLILFLISSVTFLATLYKDSLLLYENIHKGKISPEKYSADEGACSFPLKLVDR